MRRELVVAALLALAVPASGQDDPTTRFMLFNDCRPMGVVVEDMSEDAGKIGLTESDLQVVAESRLRSARIYSDDIGAHGQSYLYVQAHVVNLAYNINLQYFKRVQDEFANVGIAPTWQWTYTGLHAMGEGSVTSGLASLMDRFLVAYLRANEGACDAR